MWTTVCTAAITEDRYGIGGFRGSLKEDLIWRNDSVTAPESSLIFDIINEKHGMRKEYLLLVREKALLTAARNQKSYRG